MSLLWLVFDFVASLPRRRSLVRAIACIESCRSFPRFFFFALCCFGLQFVSLLMCDRFPCGSVCDVVVVAVPSARCNSPRTLTCCTSFSLVCCVVDSFSVHPPPHTHTVYRCFSPRGGRISCFTVPVGLTYRSLSLFPSVVVLRRLHCHLRRCEGSSSMTLRAGSMAPSVHRHCSCVVRCTPHFCRRLTLV